MIDKTLPTIHMIGIFHTYPSVAFTHCAFTGKVLRFPAMMKGSGYKIIEYANEGSESAADEHVVILSKADYESYYGGRDEAEFIGKKAVMGSPGHVHFEALLIGALRSRVKPGDIICHPFGKSHSGVVMYFPEAYHVESGIGYEDEPITAWRIYESETWRHWHIGRHHAHRLTNKNSTFVCPNYFDEKDWPKGKHDGKYVAYLARRDSSKGIFNLRDVVIEWKRRGLDEKYPEVRFHVAGQGAAGDDWKRVVDALNVFGAGDLVVDRGTLVGRERADFLGGAAIAMSPTQFTEPFGGAGVEALLCGTPIAASPFGAYAEHVEEGFNGALCRNVSDNINAITKALRKGFSSSHVIRSYALSKYGYDTVRRRYEYAFRMVSELGAGGWLG